MKHSVHTHPEPASEARIRVGTRYVHPSAEQENVQSSTFNWIADLDSLSARSTELEQFAVDDLFSGFNMNNFQF